LEGAKESLLSEFLFFLFKIKASDANPSYRNIPRSVRSVLKSGTALRILEICRNTFCRVQSVFRRKLIHMDRA